MFSFKRHLLIPKSPNINKLVAGLETHLFNKIQWGMIVEMTANTHVMARFPKDSGVVLKSSFARKLRSGTCEKQGNNSAKQFTLAYN